MNYAFFKLTVGVIATLGLYSILYRETKFYRLFEHIFLGLAAGWAMKTTAKRRIPRSRFSNTAINN